MQGWLDHLTAIIVGTVVLGVLAFLGIRGQRDAIDTTQLYGARTQLTTLTDVIQQDLANVGARVDTTEAAILDWEPGSVFEFQGAVQPSADAPVERVRYEIRAWGTTRVGGRSRNGFQLVRLVHDGTAFVESGGSAIPITAFELQLLRAGQPLPLGADPDRADEVEVYLTAAVRGQGRIHEVRWRTRHPLVNVGGFASADRPSYTDDDSGGDSTDDDSGGGSTDA